MTTGGTIERVAWLDVAPNDWFDYIDRLNLFGRYVEFCESHPDEAINLARKERAGLLIKSRCSAVLLRNL